MLGETVLGEESLYLNIFSELFLTLDNLFPLPVDPLLSKDMKNLIVAVLRQRLAFIKCPLIIIIINLDYLLFSTYCNILLSITTFSNYSKPVYLNRVHVILKLQRVL